MRHHLLAGLLAAPLLLTSASMSFATVITFDSGPFSDVTSYTEAGVTFTAVDGSSFLAVSDPNGTPGLLTDSFPSPFAEFKATVPAGTTQVAVDLGDFDSDPDLLVLRAYDATDNLLN